MRLSIIWSKLYIVALAYGLEDPWGEAQVLLEGLEKQVDPTVSSAQELDPFVDTVNTGIKITLPIDYYDKEQSRNYQEFFEKEATNVQLEVYDMLIRSSELFNNSEATYTLAQMHLVQDYGFPHNKTLAYKFLHKFNELTNFTNGSALFEEGLMHSTGLFGAIPMDIPRGLVYYEQAADLGDYRARMALAYRHAKGINVAQDPNRAQLIYHQLATELRGYFSDHEWNVFMPHFESYLVRIPDFKGGLWGKEFSLSGSSAKRLRSNRPDVTSSILTNLNSGRIVLQFGSGQSEFLEDHEESENKLIDVYHMALDNYQGTYTQKRNFELAFQLLNTTIDEFKPAVTHMDALQKFYYGRCLELLGYIYLRGDGQESTNIALADAMLTDAAHYKELSYSARYALGVLNHHYHNNITAAIDHYKQVIYGSPEYYSALFQLSNLYEAGLLPSGVMETWNGGQSRPFKPITNIFLEDSDDPRARYEHALRLTNRPMNNIPKQLKTPLHDFRSFVQSREDLVAPHLRNAFMHLLLGNSEAALWLYAQAAEQGFQEAQTNAAFILYQPSFLGEEPPQAPRERKELAATYYMRAFSGRNYDAAIVAANIFFELGDYTRAVDTYRVLPSALSSWNLGYMYEHGLGVERDFLLAKTYYEEVFNYNGSARVGVNLTLLKLYLKAWYLWFKGVSVNYWDSDSTSR